MGSVIGKLQVIEGCSGPALVLGRGRDAPPPAGVDLELTLATLLGELEARGESAKAVVVRAERRDDAHWIPAAVGWLGAHGRRVVVQTSVVLSKAVFGPAQRAGATVMLKIASSVPAIQRGLLGSGADSASALLLFAQHLRARQIEVAVRLGPLFPALHDQPEVVEPLVRHIVAADINDAHLVIGNLTAHRYRTMRDVLSQAGQIRLLRAYGLLEVLIRSGSTADDTWVGRDAFERAVDMLGEPVALPGLDRVALFHHVRRVASSTGLRIDHCGCPLQCHLDPGRSGSFVPVLTADLFEHVGTA